MRNKAQKWVFEALVALRVGFPFPVLGIDCDYADLRIMPISFRKCFRGKTFALAESA